MSLRSLRTSYADVSRDKKEDGIRLVGVSGRKGGRGGVVRGREPWGSLQVCCWKGEAGLRAVLP